MNAASFRFPADLPPVPSAQGLPSQYFCTAFKIISHRLITDKMLSSVTPLFPIRRVDYHGPSPVWRTLWSLLYCCHMIFISYSFCCFLLTRLPAVPDMVSLLFESAMAMHNPSPPPVSTLHHRLHWEDGYKYISLLSSHKFDSVMVAHFSTHPQHV